MERHLILEDDSKITFKGKETKCLNSNHDDALMVYVRMINARVRRVVIDTSNSTDILYFDIFQKLKLSVKDLTHMASSLIGFTSNSISPLKIMSLHVMFDDKLYSKSIMIKFMVVDILSVYNAIIGRPTLTRLRAMVSTYHIVMKLK